MEGFFNVFAPVTLNLIDIQTTIILSLFNYYHYHHRYHYSYHNFIITILCYAPSVITCTVGGRNTNDCLHLHLHLLDPVTFIYSYSFEVFRMCENELPCQGCPCRVIV